MSVNFDSRMFLLERRGASVNNTFLNPPATTPSGTLPGLVTPPMGDLTSPSPVTLLPKNETVAGQFLNVSA